MRLICERFTGVPVIYAQKLGGSSATFGVVVFKGSVVNWRGVDLPLDLAVHMNLLGVVVFKGSMLNWGVDLPLDLPI